MTNHYIDAAGKYIGGYGDNAEPEDKKLINVGDNPPKSSEYIWNFRTKSWDAPEEADREPLHD